MNNLYSTTFFNSSYVSFKNAGTHCVNISYLIPCAALNTSKMIVIDSIATKAITWIKSIDELTISHWFPSLKNISQGFEFYDTDPTLVYNAYTRVANKIIFTSNLLSKLIYKTTPTNLSSILLQEKSYYDVDPFELFTIVKGLGASNISKKAANISLFVASIPMSMTYNLFNNNHVADCIVPNLYNLVINSLMQKGLYDEYMSILSEYTELVDDSFSAVEDLLLGLGFKSLESYYGEETYIHHDLGMNTDIDEIEIIGNDFATAA